MSVWSAAWLFVFGLGCALEGSALVAHRQGTLSQTLERMTRSHANKALATGLMFGFVAWFVVHLGLV